MLLSYFPLSGTGLFSGPGYAFVVLSAVVSLFLKNCLLLLP